MKNYKNANYINTLCITDILNYVSLNHKIKIDKCEKTV